MGIFISKWDLHVCLDPWINFTSFPTFIGNLKENNITDAISITTRARKTTGV